MRYRHVPHPRFTWIRYHPRWIEARAAAVALCVAGAQLTGFGHPDLEQQARDLTAQIEQDATNAELLLRRGDVLRLHKEFELALADLAAAARCKRGWGMVTLVRAQTLEDAGRTREALAAADEFLKEQSGHGGALLVRARCEVRLGLGPEAVADYNAALAVLVELAPDLFLARARLQASLGRLEAAVKGLDEGERRPGIASGTAVGGDRV